MADGDALALVLVGVGALATVHPGLAVFAGTALAGALLAE